MGWWLVRVPMHFEDTGVLPAGIQKSDGTCQSFPQALHIWSLVTTTTV